MFQQKENEVKNKDAGFVDEKGNELAPEPKKEEPNPNDVNLNVKTISYDDKLTKDIEEGRLEFYKGIKKQNIFKWVCNVSGFALLIFAFVFFFMSKTYEDVPAIKYGAGVPVVCASVGIFVAYYFVTKKINNKKMGVYLKRYYGDMNAYVFGNDKFSDVHGDIDGKIPNDDFNSSLLYKDVSTLGSRNVVNFKVMNKVDAKICDCAAQKTTVRKLEPLFIGKYLMSTNTYKGNDGIIVYLNGNKRSLPPNNVSDLPKVLNTRKMVIYSKEKGYKSFLTTKCINLISELITNNILVDASISIQKGKTYIGLGYDDCLMVLPLQTKFNPIPMERYKKDMQIIADLLIELNKE